MMHYTIYDILESGSRYSKNNFPVTIFFFQETHNIWLVYFLSPTPISQHCSHNLRISWTVLILYLIRTPCKNISRDVRHTHAQFLSTFYPSLHALLHVSGSGVGKGKRADNGESDVGERKRPKMLAGMPCFPQSVTPNTCPQAQHVWDRSVDSEVTMPVGSCLFIHTCRVLQTLLPPVWGPTFFSMSMVYEGSTSDHGTKTSSREFGDVYPLTQNLLSDWECGKLRAFWIHSTAPWEILICRKTISKLLLYFVYRCF